ncbi:OprD family porin [Pseudomonas sp. S75]|uniref:OprD family porin n=1 Tax=unclassified Pseudomonas TaxID=196821 RepID=UPI00190526C3|nr:MULTISPECIES: OprD family porin [unclassified Pseudomonas]MBJ9974164.1 OprD family porin [Pseudomonas sp. S30]MBK0151906.1 OprD family porin [Pseudomonas sp. S75]
MYNNKNILRTFFTLSPCMIAGVVSAEGFVEDSKLNLQMQNYYLNRDFRDGRGQSKREEWAQGFLLDFRSGYTPGTVGFGLDALGMLGIKLDSSPDRAGTGLLPVHDDGRAADEFSRLGLTAKVRVSQSELKYGTVIPKLPTVQANTGRILPQTFEGGLLTSGEIEGLTLTGARFDRMTDRDSSDTQKITLNNKNRRFSGAVTGDDFWIGGADYALSKALTLSYQYAELQDVYRQHFLGLNHSWSIGPGKLKSDLRYMLSDDAGSAQGGAIDSGALSGLFTYSLGGHAFGVGLQKMNGETSMPYLNGTDPYLANYIQLNDFAEPGERSWQLRYDYNFAAVGIPGLTFMTRYVKGDHADPATLGQEGREWERNTDIAYVIQSGALKNVGIRWRNAAYRSNFARSADENRLIVSYTLPIW